MRPAHKAEEKDRRACVGRTKAQAQAHAQRNGRPGLAHAIRTGDASRAGAAGGHDAARIATPD
ncbi:hypothetical protein H4R99_006147 [Coemansia sp. RSA 1722]|nr:hypothetical protein IWW45_007542 [Coemansia sp. RSA 485]KAJ2593270.1 hypothetical protein H4R99_006147 [Coemansia sp. RSA 1722]